MATFGTSDIPSDQITVRSGGTVAVGAAFSRTLGLVGGMDTDNGSATEGEVVEVKSSADAATQFGENSELKEQVDLALSQRDPPSIIYCVAVSETEVTAEAAGGTSGTLSNVPAFDPNVHDEHEIVAEDTGGTNPEVNIVYDSPPSTPSDADAVNVNPVTGEFEFDAAAAGSYEFDYYYGDYASAVDELYTKVPRIAGICSENTSVVDDARSDANSTAQDFDFLHVFGGAMPEVSSGSYSDNFDDRRLAVIAPSRGFTDDAETNMVRTVGAVAGLQSGKELGDSTTYESLGGLAALNTDYNNSELGTLIDEQVYPLKHGDRIFVVKDMTTSTDPRFERVYASEIVDEATKISHSISQNFIGELNIEANRFALGESHQSSYAEMVENNLLDAAHVEVSEGANDDEVDVDIGLDVVDVMDLIDVTITVGDVVSFEGAA